MLKELLDTSVIALSLKYLYRCYCRTEQRIGDIYLNSQTYRLINGFWQSIRVSFRFSFLGRITEIREEGNTALLDNSRTVQYLIYFYKRWRDKAIYYLNTSKTVDLTKENKQNFYLLPVKTLSIIVIIAVVTNVTLSIILRRDIGLWGWSMRGLVLFVGLGGLFCDADWSTLKNSSVIFKLVSKK